MATNPLSTLLPTLNPVPPQLLQLSTSLLAQSHLRAPHLPPQTEIARAHACAEIACQRLAGRLRLPDLRGRPPCPPAKYKKALEVLSEALRGKAGGGGDVGAVGKRKHDVQTTSTPTKTPTTTAAAVTTPATKAKISAFTTALTHRSPRHSLNLNEDNIPPSLPPLLRALTAHFALPSSTPHIYSGLSHILPLAFPDSADQTDRQPMRGLLVALMFLVRARMRAREVAKEEYVRDVAAAETLVGDVGGVGGVSGWIKRVVAKGWRDGTGWWEAVPERDDDEVEDLIGDERGVREDEDNDLALGALGRELRGRFVEGEGGGEVEILRPGLGTMLTPEADFEEQKAEYLAWRRKIETQIQTVGKKSRSTRRR